jgi:N-formylglutamate amidohydrolase
LRATQRTTDLRRRWGAPPSALHAHQGIALARALFVDEDQFAPPLTARKCALKVSVWPLKRFVIEIRVGERKTRSS